jgi:UDP-glucose 4-epimerase
LEATSSYGKTKLFIEEILKDLCCAEKEWSVLSLRYFNPCGAHPSGLIGEDPKGVPANLMPYVAKVASGLLPHVNVYGTDYSTKDGTGVRDYIHICDIAHGHILALGHLQNDGFKGYDVFNLGTGVGYSVMDMIKAFSEVSGKKIRYEICSRRPGDVAAVYADSTKAKAVLKWEPKKGLQEMCQDLWRWQQMNPRGI